MSLPGRAAVLLWALFFWALLGFCPGGALASDDAAYKALVIRFKVLHDEPASGASLERWRELTQGFEGIYAHDVKRPLAAMALYYRGRCEFETAKITGKKEDFTAALNTEQKTADSYPEHSFADDALFRKAEMYIYLGDLEQARREAETLLKRFPKSDRVPDARQMLLRLGHAKSVPSKSFAEAKPEPEPEKPQRPSRPASQANPAKLVSLNYNVSPELAKVVFTLDAEIKFNHKLGEAFFKRQGRKLRIELENTQPGPGVAKKEEPGAGILHSIELEPRKSTLTAELSLDKPKNVRVYTLNDPFRVVVEITPESRPAAKQAESVDKGPRKSLAEQATPEPESLFKREKSSSRQPKPLSEVREEEADVSSRKGGHDKPDMRIRPESKSQAKHLVEQLGLTAKVVMIDPGHGGKDPGAQGLYGLVEKDLNLKLAKLLGAALQKRGFKVLYTRSSDTFISLEKRTKLANERGADVFISIHCNSHSDATTKGIEYYTLNLARSKEAVRVAARENSVDPRKISDLQSILAEIMVSSKMKESQDLARHVHDSNQEHLPANQRDRGVHEAPFYVLMGAKMPAVLVEIGYITNPSEAEKLKTQSYLESLAQGMAAGIVTYKNQLSRFAAP